MELNILDENEQGKQEMHWKDQPLDLLNEVLHFLAMLMAMVMASQMGRWSKYTEGMCLGVLLVLGG
jgi:hypothetical protein